jgi:prepilin peptidase CpaA
VSARTLLIVIVGLAGVAEDLSRRRISNWTSGGAVVAGLIVHFVQKGWSGVLHSLFGAAIGFGVFLVFYLLGGMGGGDVKLMAGFGALLGDARILPASLLAAMAGGVMAVIYLMVQAAGRSWKARSGKAVLATAAGGGRSGESIPYAPAITAGAWLALVFEM